MPTECLRCGVCCFSSSEEYVRITGDDWSRLGENASNWAHFIGNRAFMKMQRGHCAALTVRDDHASGSIFFCQIYEQRPEVCRALERGSPACEAEIERKATAVHPRENAAAAMIG